MVLGNALCALNLASTVMANGVCCFYEMQREEERKKEQEGAIRRAVHDEWERQRFMEMMERQQEKESVEKVLQDERRRRLMMSKRASVAGLSRNADTTRFNKERRQSMPPLSLNSPMLDRSQSNVSTFSVLEKKTQKDAIAALNGTSHHFLGTAKSSSHASPERQLPSLMDDIEDDLEEVHLE